MQLHERGNNQGMKKYLARFYSAYGDRGVMFILYAVSVVIHALLSVNEELPAIQPDEIGVASIAAFYSGRDWSGVMSGIGYYYGYIQAIIYTPLFALFRNPYALYKAMTVLNGVIISFIPPIAYHLATKLGVERVRQKCVIAVCCGFYVAYTAHSKFIWNEAVCSVIPWLLAWCIFMAWDRKSRFSRISWSALAGFLCGVGYAAHIRLITLTAAVLLTVICAQVFFREKTLNMPAFVITGAATFGTERLCAAMIKQGVWLGGAQFNTAESELARLGEVEGQGSFFGTLFGHIYTFMTSTAGAGAMAVVITACIIASQVYRWYNRRPVTGEDGTRSYTKIKRRYDLRLTIFALYALFAVGGTLLGSVLYKFKSEKAQAIQDLTIFGRYTDSAAPLAIFLVLAFMFIYGIRLRHILAGAGVYGLACLLFGLCGYRTVAAAQTYRESPIIGLLPWRMGENITAPLTGMSFVIMSSCIFSMFALCAVFSACTKRHINLALSVMICSAAIYTNLFVGTVYLPMRAQENAVLTAPAKAVSELIYNDSQSPVVAAYLVPSRTASLVQFLNPDVRVLIVKDRLDLPENCILITEKTRSVPFPSRLCDKLGETDDYAVYAVGEGARDFIKYKISAE